MKTLESFRFNIFVPGFCYFRKPTTTAYLDTYSIPPPTTIRGLLSNAIGLTRDDLRLQDMIMTGIRNNGGYIMEETAKHLKEPKSYFPGYMYNKDEYLEYLRLNFMRDTNLKIPEEEVRINTEKNIKSNNYKVRSITIEYSTSPIRRRVIIDGCYTIYIASEDRNLLDKLREKLASPERPLYFGASDSIADVYGISSVVKLANIDSNLVNTACLGIHGGGNLAKLPYKFIKMNNKINLLYSPLMTVFEKYPAVLADRYKLFKFEEEHICLL